MRGRHPSTMTAGCYICLTCASGNSPISDRVQVDSFTCFLAAERFIGQRKFVESGSLI